MLLMLLSLHLLSECPINVHVFLLSLVTALQSPYSSHDPTILFQGSVYSKIIKSNLTQSNC